MCILSYVHFVQYVLYVPVFSRLFPNADIRRAPFWSGFASEHSGVHFVEPTDPLYFDLGSRFLKIQKYSRDAKKDGTERGHTPKLLDTPLPNPAPPQRGGGGSRL